MIEANVLLAVIDVLVAATWGLAATTAGTPKVRWVCLSMTALFFFNFTALGVFF